MFVTVWMGILDLRNGSMTCANAGHEYPEVRGEDGVFRMLSDKHGLPLGVMPGMKYRDYAIQLHPSDAAFIYTDGVPEANNPDGEQYGAERMQQALNRVPGFDPERLLKDVRADVDAFVRGADQFDDLTMLCVIYRGGKGVGNRNGRSCSGNREQDGTECRRLEPASFIAIKREQGTADA